MQPNDAPLINPQWNRSPPPVRPAGLFQQHLWRLPWRQEGVDAERPAWCCRSPGAPARRADTSGSGARQGPQATLSPSPRLALLEAPPLFPSSKQSTPEFNFSFSLQHSTVTHKCKNAHCSSVRAARRAGLRRGRRNAGGLPCPAAARCCCVKRQTERFLHLGQLIALELDQRINLQAKVGVGSRQE